MIDSIRIFFIHIYRIKLQKILHLHTFERHVQLFIGNPYPSYVALPAIWDHTVLPATGIPVPNLHTPERWKAELIKWLVIFRDGLPVCRQSLIQIVLGLT